MPYTPFKVTFHIATPIIMPFSTTLDGLLSAAASSFSGHTHGEELRNAIPLARDKETGVFHASSLFLTGRLIHQQLTKNRGLRSDDDLDARHIKPKRKKNGELASTPYPKMETSKGDYAHRLSSYHAVKVSSVVAYGLGDIEAVRSHLDILMGLGRHAQQGCGEIRHTNIEEIDSDLSLVSAEGYPQRQLPVELWERLGGEGTPLKSMMAVLPPYWDEALVECVLPPDPAII